MNYPISFNVVSAEHIVKTNFAHLTAPQIRAMVWGLYIKDDRVKTVNWLRHEITFNDGSRVKFSNMFFDAPTTAYKAPEQIRKIERNQFNLKDNIGGVQGHSQGSFYPFVIGSFGNGDWGVWYGGHHVRFAHPETAFAFAEHCKAQGIKSSDAFAAYGKAYKGE